MAVTSGEYQKILLVGPVKYTVSPWILLWAKNLRELGFTVRIFDPREAIRVLGVSFKNISPKIHSLAVRAMNRRLLQLAKRWKPELVLCLKGDLVYPSTIKKMSELGAITLLWFPDDPWLFYTIAREIAPAYDYVVTSSEKCVKWYKHIGCKHVKYLPFMCDPDIHKRVNLTEEERKYYGADLCFVGSYAPERERYFEVLCDYDFKIFGSGWDRARQKVRAKWMGRPLSIFEMVKAFNASKIVLNLHTAETKYGGMKANMRVFEATGCGAFHLADRTEGLSDLFILDKEVAVYDSKEELREKVDYYLDNPEEREKIARRGQERAYKDHTFKKRIEELFEFIGTV